MAEAMLARFFDLFVSGAALISGTLVLGLLLGVLSTLFARTTPRKALRTLAAYDIGSGATKVLVAEVDSLGVIIGSPLYEAEKPMAFKADAQAHGGSLSKGIQELGLELVQALVAKARELGATEASGIATEVFRTAPNGRAFLDQISAKTGIAITILSQEYEARLGLATAEALIGTAGPYDAVWDSGGGSFQICARQEGIPSRSAPIASVPLRCFTGKLGTTPALERLLVQVQSRPFDLKSTPNPVTPEQAGRLVAVLASELAPAPMWLRHGTVAAIGGWNCIFAVTLRTLRQRLPDFVLGAAGEGHREGDVGAGGKGGAFTMDDARRALDAVVGATDEQLLPIAGTSADAEGPNLVVGKVALLVAVGTHLGLDRIVYRPATGGCAGLFALGEFKEMA